MELNQRTTLSQIKRNRSKLEQIDKNKFLHKQWDQDQIVAQIRSNPVNSRCTNKTLELVFKVAIMGTIQLSNSKWMRDFNSSLTSLAVHIICKSEVEVKPTYHQVPSTQRWATQDNSLLLSNRFKLASTLCKWIQAW